MHDIILYIDKYQASLNIASILICILLYYVFRSKVKFSLKFYWRYLNLIILVFLCALLGTCDQVLRLEPFKQLTSLKYFVHLSYIFGLFLNTASLTTYLLSLIGIESNYEKRWNYISFVPIYVFGAFDFTTFIHEAFIYYDASGNLCNGKYYNLIYIFVIYYVILWLFISIYYHKLISKNRVGFIIATAFLCALSGIIFASTHFLGLFNLVFATLLIIIIYSAQRPDEIFDPSSALRRGLLFHDLESDISRHTYFSVLFIKITNFKYLIDSLGEVENISLLQSVCDYLKNTHSNASVYRLDNETFALHIPDNDEKRMYFLADSILTRFETEFSSISSKALITASIIILSSPDDVVSLDAFKKCTRKISSTNVESGKIIKIADCMKNDREKDIIRAVKKAMGNNSFRVFYQPIYSTEKKKVIAAEALIRLFDDQMGFISPEEFIPLAEKEGLILKIGKFVFTEVCKFIKKENLLEKGIEYIEVNLSAVQCTHYKLAEEFIEIMNQYGISPDQINFEITESSVLVNNMTVSANIGNFINHGVELSLDDYGTGYSNITYLSSMPFAIIKVDKSILWAADKNEKANITLENIFDMARDLKMKVVVEGVETEEHVKKLLKVKCDYFQGYYFSKPVKGSEFLDFIENFEIPEVCK